MAMQYWGECSESKCKSYVDGRPSYFCPEHDDKWSTKDTKEVEVLTPKPKYKYLSALTSC